VATVRHEAAIPELINHFEECLKKRPVLVQMAGYSLLLSLKKVKESTKRAEAVSGFPALNVVR